FRNSWQLPPLQSAMHSQRPNPSRHNVPEKRLQMNSQPEWLGIQSRRNFLGNAGKALALAGAASILGRGENLLASLAKENSRPLHSSPKAARVIHILMTGGPS